MADKNKPQSKTFSKPKKQLKALEALAKEGAFLDRTAKEAAVFAKPQRLGVLPDEPELELGNRLQQAREAKNLTQGQLAEETKRADREGKGLSRAVVSLYELGTNRPGPREIRILCETLQITPSYLIYGVDEPFDNFLNRHRHGVSRPRDPESFANILYCFTRLHPHHRMAVMELMLGLLRGWNKGFDEAMDNEANQTLLEVADNLRELLNQREQQEV